MFASNGLYPMQVRLEPNLGCLPPAGGSLPLRLGCTASLGIGYARSRPPFSAVEGDGSRDEVGIRPKDDDVLWRFYPLGWMLNQFLEKTGHVLVIDMDRDRGRHPWVVLAPEWTGIESHEPCVYRPKRDLLRDGYDYDDCLGFLEGNMERTTIAKLFPLDCARKKSHVLKRFGRGLSLGGRRG